MNKLTEALSFDQYQDLIAGYFIHPISIVAYNSMSMVSWYSEGCLKQNSYPHPNDILSNGKNKYRDQTLKLIELEERENCIVIEVQDANDELFVTIAVFFLSQFSGQASSQFSGQDAEDEFTHLIRIVPSIAAISQLVQTEYTLNHELNGMANELSDRYDELNLVYATDDDIQSRTEADLALVCLIQNCCEYLGVPLSVMIVPQCNVNIHYQKKNSTIDNLDNILSFVNDDLYKLSSNLLEPIVLNTPEDYANERLQFATEGKFISIPILTKGGSARGILACYKPEVDSDYSNSDKNLLLTMVRKITKMLNANFDGLTGLLSRQAFEFSVESAVLSSIQEDNISSILYIDIDKTQIINDLASHHAGDATINQIAEIIKAHVKVDDPIARIGGDVFGVLIQNCGKDDAEKIANEIRLVTSKTHFSWKQHLFDTTLSIGVCEVNEQSVSGTSAISAAELSCDTAKEQGRNAVVTYNDNNTEVMERKSAMHWVNRIQVALREEKFILFAQPIQILNGKSESFHFEILLRMRDEDGSILSPASFMQAAEIYNMMPELDEHVIKSAIATFETHWDRIADKNGSIAINLSGQSIRKNGFLEFILKQLSCSRIPASAFCFEVTETTALGSLNEAKHFIQQLKKIGCKFSLDDFGTGLSSFSYLKLLPVDYLKIDGCFVKDILSDSVNNEMVQAIHRVGSVMNLKTIAEFVEDEGTMDHLRSIGINYGQGYHIGKPILFEERLEMLTNNLGQHMS